LHGNFHDLEWKFGLLQFTVILSPQGYANIGMEKLSTPRKGGSWLILQLVDGKATIIIEQGQWQQ